MPKKTPQETDEARLAKKFRERRAPTDNPEGDVALRALRKRLKRAQRKRRRLAARRRQAAGKQASTDAKAEATTGS